MSRLRKVCACEISIRFRACADLLRISASVFKKATSYFVKATARAFAKFLIVKGRLAFPLLGHQLQFLET